MTDVRLLAVRFWDTWGENDSRQRRFNKPFAKSGARRWFVSRAIFREEVLIQMALRSIGSLNRPVDSSGTLRPSDTQMAYLPYPTLHPIGQR